MESAELIAILQDVRDRVRARNPQTSAGKLVLRYVPDKLCLELKSYKMYLLAYRNLGIFQENVVNRVLQDVVAATKPVSAIVIGDFSPRGGLSTLVTATWKARRGKR